MARPQGPGTGGNSTNPTGGTTSPVSITPVKGNKGGSTPPLGGFTPIHPPPFPTPPPGPAYAFGWAALDTSPGFGGWGQAQADLDPDMVGQDGDGNLIVGIPMAAAGINLLDDPMHIGGHELVKCQNAFPTVPGVLSKRGVSSVVAVLGGLGLGSLNIGPAVIESFTRPPIVGFPDTIFTAKVLQANGDQHTVLYVMDSQNPTIYTTYDFGGQTDGRPTLVTLGNAVYCFPGFNGSNTPGVRIAVPLNSQTPTITPITWQNGNEGNAPIPYPKVACVWMGRMYFGNLGPGLENMVIASDDTGDPTLIASNAIANPGGFNIIVGPRDGGIVTAMAVVTLTAQGSPDQSALLIFKTTGVYLLMNPLPFSTDAVSATSLPVVEQLAFNAGCEAKETIAVTPFGTIWASGEDVWAFTFGQVPYRIGTKLRPLLVNAPPSQKFRWTGAYFNGVYRLAIHDPSQVTPAGPFQQPVSSATGTLSVQVAPGNASPVTGVFNVANSFEIGQLVLLECTNTNDSVHFPPGVYQVLAASAGAFTLSGTGTGGPNGWTLTVTECPLPSLETPMSQYWLDLRNGMPPDARTANWFGPMNFQSFDGWGDPVCGTSTLATDTRPGQAPVLFGVETLSYQDPRAPSSLAGVNKFALVAYDQIGTKDADVNTLGASQLVQPDIAVDIWSKAYDIGDPYLDKLFQKTEGFLWTDKLAQLNADLVFDQGDQIVGLPLELAGLGFVLGVSQLGSGPMSKKYQTVAYWPPTRVVGKVTQLHLYDTPGYVLVPPNATICIQLNGVVYPVPIVTVPTSFTGMTALCSAIAAAVQVFPALLSAGVTFSYNPGSGVVSLLAGLVGSGLGLNFQTGATAAQLQASRVIGSLLGFNTNADITSATSPVAAGSAVYPTTAASWQFDRFAMWLSPSPRRPV